MRVYQANIYRDQFFDDVLRDIDVGPVTNRGMVERPLKKTIKLLPRITISFMVGALTIKDTCFK